MNRSNTRRRFVRGAVGAAIVGLAGCGSPGTGAEGTTAGGTTEAGTTEGGMTEEGTTEGGMTEEGTAEGGMTEGGDAEAEETPPAGVSEEQFVSGPVPPAYRTATSQAGEQRDPNNLQTKESVRYQEASDAESEELITPGPNCGNCAEFIPDENGDGFGACAKVEGYIAADNWCVLWESIEEAQAEGS